MFKYSFALLFFALISCCRLRNEITYQYNGTRIIRIDEFGDDGKVTLLSGDGSFHSENTDTSKFEFKRITATQRPVLGKSVYYISLSIRYEKERNHGSTSEIETRYDLDNSEWW